MIAICLSYIKGPDALYSSDIKVEYHTFLSLNWHKFLPTLIRKLYFSLYPYICVITLYHIYMMYMIWYILFIFIHIYIYIYIYINIYVHVYIYKYICICIYIYKYLCICIYIYIYIYVYIYVTHIFTYILTLSAFCIKRQNLIQIQRDISLKQ